MLFSIIVPIYNVAPYLKMCIESILNQTFEDFELILVDDGSTDDSGKICDECKLKDKRIEVLHKKNGGLVSARKAGANAAEGAYIIPVDGDDWVSHDLLLEAYRVLEKDRVDIICYGYYTYRENRFKYLGMPQAGKYYNRKDIENTLLCKLNRSEKGEYFSPCVSGKIFEKGLYVESQNAVPDAATIAEDGCVTYPCVYKANSICFLDKPLAYYRYNPDSMTKTKKAGYSFDNVNVVIEHLKSVLPLHEYSIGEQLDRMTVHMLFDAARSWLRTDMKYSESKRLILKNLDRPEFQSAITRARYKGNIKESLAAFAVRHRAIWLIALYVKISRGMRA